jgi:hypothetical protein
VPNGVSLPHRRGDLHTAMTNLLNISVAAVLTLFVYSYLLRDNALYRIAGHLLVGLGVAYALTVAVYNVLLPNLLLPLRDTPTERADLLIPFTLGILLLAKAVPRGARLGNAGVAYLLGAGLGVSVGGALVGTLIPQIIATMRPLAPVGGVDVGQAILNGIILVGTVVALLAFAYTRPATTPTLDDSNIAATDNPTLLYRIGRWVLMVAFGAILGGTILTYTAALTGRWDFLINEWLFGFYQLLT